MLLLGHSIFQPITLPVPVITVYTTYKDALNKAAHYRDIAEQLKAQNRKLHVELSEKVETVWKFWRNKVLEERSHGGKMVMSALRNSISNKPANIIMYINVCLDKKNAISIVHVFLIYMIV